MFRTLALVFCIMIPCTTAFGAQRRPNVVFIAVDDLRPEIGCYGAKHMHTPNIDRLAKQGTVFERAYCMVPTCGASRASLLTGIRPARGRFVNFHARADKDAPGVTTLNTHFKNNGYHTISNGKIFHYPADNVEGWSEKPWNPKDFWMGYILRESKRIWERHKKETPGGGALGPAYEAADVEDDAYADGDTANKATADLRRLAKMDDPFLLAVGFFKPHLPFIAPKKYWDLYDRDNIRLPETYHRPKDAPDEAIHNWGELRRYAEIPAEGPLSDEMARTLIHGYYACVSYTDAQVGKLLDELKRLKLEDNTIVILWGDHGWNLGEHTLWCKHCCFETSMHAPLIVSAPGINGGVKAGGLTEFIDIYPSLCELAGIPTPEHLQGKSFVPLMKTPALEWKPAAIGRYGKGDTIRTDKYRFTEYADAKGKFLSRMLYDHETDPGEDVNISERKDNETVVRELAEMLNEGKGKD